MDELLRLARRPAVTTHRGATIQEACEVMMSERVGALAVIEEGHLVGILSERDVVGRVVVPRRDPQKTLVGEVMTRDVSTANAAMTVDQALEAMHHGRFRHLPVLDGTGRVVGMVSVRHLLRHRVELLDMRASDLVAYFSVDGPGG
jgi:CBS domain-containing protein